MLQTARQNVAIELRVQLARNPTAGARLDGIKKLSEERRTAHRVIGAQYPLDDFTGILLTDGYDEIYVAAVDSLARSFLAADTDLPSSEAGAYFQSRMVDLPPLNDAPAAFVVAFVVMRCVQSALSPPDTLAPAVRGEISEVAVRAVAAVTRHFREGRSSSEARRKADETWQTSVIERVRCPTHHTPFTIKELRNGIRKDGSFYRRYVGICQGGSETRRFDFDLEALNQVARSGGLQNLPARLPPPRTKQPGVDQ